MRIVHLIVGDNNAHTLAESIKQNGPADEELLVLHDLLDFGPLKTEGLGFSEGRTAFWKKIIPEATGETDDLERLMQLSTRLSNGEALTLWFWMAATASDVCAYFWLLHFLKKHQGRLALINIAGLPFLDENGKLFYAESIARLPEKELMKARKLARPLTPSEWEADGEEWKKMIDSNAAVRALKEGKTLSGQPVDFYDEILITVAAEGNIKTHKIIQKARLKCNIPNGDLFLSWRLNVLAEEGKIAVFNKADIETENS